MFAIISYGQVVLVCSLSPLFMAGAIGRTRGQTYNILLTTPLSNLQIVSSLVRPAVLHHPRLCSAACRCMQYC
ncbi:MAG: hypothetical protein R3C45_03675 [Phycisphaerales bacterium]